MYVLSSKAYQIKEEEDRKRPVRKGERKEDGWWWVLGGGGGIVDECLHAGLQTGTQINGHTVHTTAAAQTHCYELSSSCVQRIFIIINAVSYFDSVVS